ncbi:cation:proton antiporter, partial [Staphylococcus aureus]|nr:cation:proton antiporter [Staphylococcus aureus]
SLVSAIELQQFGLTLTIIVVAIGVIASIFTFVYAVYMLKETYWGEFDEKKVPKKHIHEPWLFSLPAIILMVMIPIIFFIPNFFTEHLVLPALRNVTNLGSSADAIAPHVSQWHGVNLPLIFSVIVIIVGLIVALKVNWKAITHQVIKYASITNSYRNVYRGFERYSGQMIRGLMNNRLNHYNIITVLIFSILIAYGIFQVG